MREIKFRGYNAKNKQWLYGFYLQNRGGHFICPDEFANGKSWEDYEVAPDTIGQFTGLYDKNEREIYEGDIVKWTNYCYESGTSHTADREIISGVKFDCGEFTLSNEPCHGLRNVFDVGVWESIVIGNIHDNPGLLKQDN